MISVSSCSARMRSTSGSSIAEHARLDRQTLAQIARRDATRVELLHRGERGEHHVLAHAGLARDLVERRGQIAAIVEVADDEARRRSPARPAATRAGAARAGARRASRGACRSRRSRGDRRGSPPRACPCADSRRDSPASRRRRTSRRRSPRPVVPESASRASSGCVSSAVASVASAASGESPGPAASAAARSSSLSMPSSSTGFSCSSCCTRSTSSMRESWSSLIACCSCGVITSCWLSRTCCLSSSAMGDLVSRRFLQRAGSSRPDRSRAPADPRPPLPESLRG